MRVCFSDWACGTCHKGGDDLWVNEEHLLIKIIKIYLTTTIGVAMDHPKIMDPKVVPGNIGFRAWIVEPGEMKCNMWQFWIKTKQDIWGRPCGASASSYIPTDPGKRRKRGAWLRTPWVPKDAIDECVDMFLNGE